MSFFLCLLVFFQCSFLLYFLYTMPLFNVAFVYSEGISSSINFVFILFVFVIILLLALLLSIVITKEREIQKYSFSLVGIMSLLSVAEIFVAYTISTFLNSSADSITLFKNIILNRIWTFEEKFNYVVSYLGASSLDYLVVKSIINDTNSLQLLKEKVDVALFEKDQLLLKEIKNVQVEEVSGFLSNHLTEILVASGFVIVIAMTALYFFGRGSTPPPGGTSTSESFPDVDDFIEANTIIDIPVIDNNNSIATNIRTMRWGWDKFSAAKEEMWKYWNFKPQKNLTTASLQQHDDLVPTYEVDLTFDQTSSSLLRKTYSYFANMLQDLKSGNNQIASNTFDYISASGEVTPVDANTIISLPLNYFIQAMPLDIVSYQEKINGLLTWISMHELEITFGIGSFFVAGIYGSYLLNETQLTLTYSPQYKYTFMQEHPFLRFLHYVGNEFSGQDNFFTSHVLSAEMDIIRMDRLFVQFERIITARGINVNNMAEVRNSFYQIFLMVAYKTYSFIYAQLDYLSNMACISEDEEFQEAFLHCKEQIFASDELLAAFQNFVF